ncbi:MAG: histidine phosphatase family protein [Candidatus Obscuribacterales bacterium]|nr:histidine phosphatase family protein [Candidatus Obscuribacterales bacterium]
MAEEKEPLHPEEVVTSVLLARHGHTIPTEEGLLYTDPDAPLTERGERQASALSAWLSTQKVDVLLSSPSKRVLTTAEIVGAKLKTSPVIVEDLNEWNVGSWDGKSYWDIKKNEPAAYARWSKDPIHIAPPGGESIAGLCQRVKEQVREIISNHQGKSVTVITHAGVIRGVLCYSLGIPAENFWRLSIPTGSISKVDFSESFATVQFTAFVP